MNNRQKAKHFKRKYEALLKNKPMMPTIIDGNKQLTRLRIQRTIPNDDMQEIVRGSMWSPDVDTPMSHIKRSIANELSRELMSRISLNVKPSNVRWDCTEIEAEICFYE